MAEGTTIDWGDGTPKQDAPAEGEVTHEYDKSLDGKKQTIKVCKKDAPDECTEITFTPGEEGGGGTPTPTPEPGGELKLTAKEADGDDEHMTVSVSVDNGDKGKVKIDFGDGSDTEETDQGGTVTHKYPRAGKFPIKGTDTDDPDRTDTVSVTVPFGGGDTPTPTPTPEPEPEPKAKAEADDTDEKGRTVKLTYEGFPKGDVMISWGDKSTETEAKGPEGEKTHAYTEDAEGEQTITVTGAKDSKATAKFTPKKPGGDKPGEVKLKVVEDKDDDKGMTVIATVDNGGNPATVDFGDKSEKVTNKGDGKDQSKHKYKDPADYTVTAEDKEDGAGDDAKKDSADITVPWGETPTPTPTPEPEPKPEAEAKADPDDETARTAAVTYSGFPKGKITADWGDGKKTQVDGPKGKASHEYGKDVKDKVTIVFTSVEDEKMKAETTFTPKAASVRRRYRT